MSSDLLSSLIGQKAQGCWLGYGDVLFLEFGEPQQLGSRRNHPLGEWSLWCDRIRWRIEQGNRVLAGSEDDRDQMERAVDHLNGNILISAHLVFPSGDSLLTFTNDLMLRTFVTSTEEDARWNLRDCHGQWFAVGPDRLYLQKSSKEQSSP